LGFVVAIGSMMGSFRVGIGELGKEDVGDLGADSDLVSGFSFSFCFLGLRLSKVVAFLVFFISRVNFPSLTVVTRDRSIRESPVV